MIRIWQVFVILAVFALGILILACSNKSSLYDPGNEEGIRLFAFVADSFPETTTLSDSSRFAKKDTFHTKDTARFVAIVAGDASRLTRTVWRFGDGDSVTTLFASHVFTRGKIYKSVCLIMDEAGNMLSDTVVVHVNTPPRADSLIVPADGQKFIDPSALDGVMFKWVVTDPDSGDSLRVDLFIDTIRDFKSPVMNNITVATCYSTIPSKPLTAYFWRIVVRDRYGDADTSKTSVFFTKDPNATRGVLNGYAFFQGKRKHDGILISVIDKSAGLKPQYFSTDASGRYSADMRDGKFRIIARDTLRHAFTTDSVDVSVTIGDTATADTIVLRDIGKPFLWSNVPTTVQNIREPAVSCLFYDSATGINPSSVRLTINDSDVTTGASVAISGLSWKPSIRMCDDTYRVCVWVADSIGNRDSILWSFSVAATKFIPVGDTVVTIFDTVWFPCSLLDAYGNTVQYKWDFDGNGTWDDSVSGAIHCVTRPWQYVNAGVHKAILYGRDGSGKTAFNTVRVTVLLDPPAVALGSDTIVLIGDTMRITAHAYDAYGRVQKYYWSFDGMNFSDSTNDSTVSRIYSSAGPQIVCVKVRDDDRVFSAIDSAIVTAAFVIKKWTFSTAGPIQSSPVLGSDGTIYLGSNDGKLYAINSDGSKKWEIAIGGAVSSSPAIGTDGTIYAGASTKLFAVNPEGTKKWEFGTRGTVSSSPALGVDGTVYVGSNDSCLYAVNQDGIKKWEFKTGLLVRSSPAIRSDGVIIVASDDRNLYAIQSDGTLKWKSGNGAVSGSSPAIGGDGTVYVGGSDGFLYATDPTVDTMRLGIKPWKWKFSTRTSDTIWYSINASPSVASDGTIYAGCGDGKLYAVSPQGVKTWDFTTGGPISSPSAIDAEGTIYVGSQNNKVYAINPDGSKKWEFATGGPVYSGPVIDAKGVVYIGSWDNKLYAFATAGRKGLALSAWPMFHRDINHSGRFR